MAFDRSPLLNALSRWRFWLALGLFDVRMRYRRSVLGPWWVTIATLTSALAVGALYSRLFGQPVREFVPYVAAGFVGWSLIAASIGEAPTALVARAASVSGRKAVSVPLLFADMVRRCVVFAHGALAALAVTVFVGSGVGAATLLFVPNTLLAVAVLTSFSVPLAFLGARFRDVPELVGVALVLLFLVTPVLWRPEQVPDAEWIVALNPFAAVLELLRAPLIAEIAPVRAYFSCLVQLLIGLVLSSTAVRSGEGRVALWVQ